MKTRMFEFRLPQTQGLPRVLVLGLLLVLAVAVISLVIMVGVAVAVVGLSVSAAAALWYAVRRGLNLAESKPLQKPVETPAEWSSGQVHDVEVEVLPIEELRRH
jgi:hypothetical protein